MRKLSLLATDKLIYMDVKRRFSVEWIFMPKREKVLSCLSLGTFMPRPSQDTVIEWHNRRHVMNDDDEDDDDGDSRWPSLKMYHVLGPVLSASYGLCHWILAATCCIIILTLQLQTLRLVKINKYLQVGSPGNEQTQAVSPKRQWLKILFLNLNYFLAPAVIITISYKIFELNLSSVWRFHLF